MFNKDSNKRYFSTFCKAKKAKKHFQVLLSGPSRCYYLVQVWCFLKMDNLDQIITPERPNLDQILTPQHIYIYVYMLLCSIMGCFFCPMRSRMLPVMRSKMGCAASAGRKSLFLQCFVGSRRAAVTARGPRNTQRRLGATC